MPECVHGNQETNQGETMSKTKTKKIDHPNLPGVVVTVEEIPVGELVLNSKPDLKRMGMEMTEILNKYGKTVGVEFSVGNMRYDSDGSRVSTKIEVTKVGAESKEAADFRLLAHNYGLDPDAVGKDIVVDGEAFTITGMRPRSRKYPIEATRKLNGQCVKFGALIVRLALERQKAEVTR
jgi:hypothetical protein